MNLMKMTTVAISIGFLTTTAFAHEMAGKQYGVEHYLKMEHHAEDFSRSKGYMDHKQKQMMFNDKIRHHENIRVMELERELYQLQKMNELLEKQVNILQEMNNMLKQPMRKDLCHLSYPLCYKKKYDNLKDKMDYHKPFYREQHMNLKRHNEMMNQNWDELDTPSTMPPDMRPDYNDYNDDNSEY
mgnify:CR=1 FL=1